MSLAYKSVLEISFSTRGRAAHPADAPLGGGRESEATTERHVVGLPAFPAQASRSLAPCVR
jgi:hypothetical protein